jgi:hypothetical protein
MAKSGIKRHPTDEPCLLFCHHPAWFLSTEEFMSEEQANWMELYQSALLEFDPIKLPLRLQEARQAVEQRLQELKHDNANAHDGDGTQLQALADALQNLRVLSRTEAGGA